MMSDARQFRSAPVTDPDTSFTFIVYGDMGNTPIPGSHDTAKYLVEEAKDGSSLVFHVGDISYARGYVSAFQNSVQNFPKIFSFRFFLNTFLSLKWNSQFLPRENEGIPFLSFCSLVMLAA